MTETTENKAKIFHVAKDLNLSSTTIIDFLKKKGYPINGPMSIVDNEMMKDIMSELATNTDSTIWVICPRCTEQLYVRDGIYIISCFTCGLQFRIAPQRKVQHFFYRLFAKIKSLIPHWIATNWSKIVTKVEHKIISETIIYESHCWYCQSPIKSVKTEVKEEHFLRYQIGVLWLGNKKCPKTNCKYFLCGACGRCYCDYDDPSLRKPSELIEKKWLEENPQKASSPA